MPIVQDRHTVTARWIFGSDAFTAQTYIVHSEYPVFVAKTSHSEPRRFPTCLEYQTTDGRCFFDFTWFDPYPGEQHFLSLMREAERALKAHLFERAS
jgi:hypothetical protein